MLAILLVSLFENVTADSGEFKGSSAQRKNLPICIGQPSIQFL